MLLPLLLTRCSLLFLLSVSLMFIISIARLTLCVMRRVSVAQRLSLLAAITASRLKIRTTAASMLSIRISRLRHVRITMSRLMQIVMLLTLFLRRCLFVVRWSGRLTSLEQAFGILSLLVPRLLLVLTRSIGAALLLTRLVISLVHLFRWHLRLAIGLIP